jgi:U3 small nucleolar RNA-associated protein 10
MMSLFTFMGNSILRQDDSYSTQLIQQTVINIIPALAKTNREEVHTLEVSAGIFRVFTSAVKDIPVHRRLPVFTSLVQTLDPAKSMWQLCIILVDNALQRDRKRLLQINIIYVLTDTLSNAYCIFFRSNLNADLELAVELVWQFGPEIVAQTVRQTYEFLVSLPVFTSMFY